MLQRALPTVLLSRRGLLAAGVGAGMSVAMPKVAALAPAPLPEWPAKRLRVMGARLTRIEAKIGHGNFNLSSFDDVRKAARSPGIGALTVHEEAEFEALFALDARRIGFLGPRVTHSLSAALPIAGLLAVAGTGQHVFPEALAVYERARRAVGTQLIVTSGARGVPKQMLVFINSTLRSGVIARTVHSVAPPGYSYHAVGDIDVGDRHLGGVNFTAAFANSATYKKIAALDFIHFRYPIHNTFGVQFEPWHLQIAK